MKEIKKKNKKSFVCCNEFSREVTDGTDMVPANADTFDVS
jgi:hypothetical protein